MTKTLIKTGIGLSFVLLALVLAYFFPWNQINWGKVSLAQDRSVTVVGTAQSQKTNEIASFTAGVNAVNDNKEKAVAEVNEKVTALIASVKQFGIADKDIKTQNMNIYQNQETYYEDGVQKQRLGQWNVSNSVEVTLREVARAQELTDILSKSNANNVYGPNFSLDDGNNAETGLTEAALKDAREKAEVIAKASGAKLGKVVTVTEGGVSTQYPVFAMKDSAMGGGGSPVEVGSTTVSKSITVTFELK